MQLSLRRLNDVDLLFISACSIEAGGKEKKTSEKFVKKRCSMNDKTFH